MKAKIALEAAITEGKAITESEAAEEYTEESIAALKAEIAEAAEVLN